MKTLLLAVALAGCMQAALAADSASGSFKNQDLGMQIKSAIAFNGKSSLDKANVIVVAVTSADMDSDAQLDNAEKILNLHSAVPVLVMS